MTPMVARFVVRNLSTEVGGRLVRIALLLWVLIEVGSSSDNLMTRRLARQTWADFFDRRRHDPGVLFRSVGGPT